MSDATPRKQLEALLRACERAAEEAQRQFALELANMPTGVFRYGGCQRPYDRKARELALRKLAGDIQVFLAMYSDETLFEEVDRLRKEWMALREATIAGMSSLLSDKEFQSCVSFYLEGQNDVYSWAWKQLWDVTR